MEILVSLRQKSITNLPRHSFRKSLVTIFS
jgi:hypothetical protein